MRLRTFLCAAAVATASLAAVVLKRPKPPAPPALAPTPPASSEASPIASIAPPPSAPPPSTPPPAPRPRARRGGMDLTFLVTADTHVGFWEKIPIPTAPSGVPLDDVH